MEHGFPSNALQIYKINKNEFNALQSEEEKTEFLKKKKQEYLKMK
jgi:hypothetical protein